MLSTGQELSIISGEEQQYRCNVIGCKFTGSENEVSAHIWEEHESAVHCWKFAAEKDAFKVEAGN